MMEGCSLKKDCEATSQTVILVGRTGNGKSATGNTILGRRVFRSERSPSGVTTTSELQATDLDDGKKLNVIDTPGLFDPSVDAEFIAKEIICCTNMVKDGVHAFLAVLSVRRRFSKEEEASISGLHTLFGDKIYDYMIVVFTGGDELEADDETLEDYLHDSPQTLKETLRLCGDRCVLFDNKTRDQAKIASQVQKLLCFLKLVSINNGGKPYTNEIFTDLKKVKEQAERFQVLKETERCTEKEKSVMMEQIRDERFNRIAEMFGPKLKETALSLERQLEEERAAQISVIENAKAAESKYDEEKNHILVLLEEIEREREQERKRKPLQELLNGCLLKITKWMCYLFRVFSRFFKVGK